MAGGNWALDASNMLKGASVTSNVMVPSSQNNVSGFKCKDIWGPQGPHKHKDPTNHGFWYPAYIMPWSQHVRALCSCGPLALIEVPAARSLLLGLFKPFLDP